MKALFARDGAAWVVLWYGGVLLQVVIGGITVDVMANTAGVPAGLAEWGLNPTVWKWLSLVNPLLTAFAGKQGMSWVPLTRNLGGIK